MDWNIQSEGNLLIHSVSFSKISPFFSLSLPKCVSVTVCSDHAMDSAMIIYVVLAFKRSPHLLLRTRVIFYYTTFCTFPCHVHVHVYTSVCMCTCACIELCCVVHNIMVLYSAVALAFFSFLTLLIHAQLDLD